MNPSLTRRERGWPGHFISAHACLFRRNTLISDDVVDRHIVVSTVGAMRPGRGAVESIGLNRWYETMVFVGQHEGPYIDANVSKQISINGPEWGIFAETREGLSLDSDNRADAIHEAMVDAVMRDFDSLWEGAQ